MAQPQVPSRRVMGELAREALDNAVELVQDARLLIERSRPARAYALAVLALEEYGKHLSCLGAATVPEDEGEYWQRFMKNFRNHKAKYGVGLTAVLAARPADVDEDPRAPLMQLVRDDQVWKMRGFYVDFVNGVILTPSAVTTAMADGTVRVAGEVIDQGAEHWVGVDLGELFERPIEHSVPGVSAAMAAGDAEEVMRLLQPVGSP